MKSKFKVGEIVRQVRWLYANEDPICKITKIEGDRVHHIHRGNLNIIVPLNASENDFEKIPKLLQILYDDF